MYRKATLDDCNKVYNLICEMECKQLAFDRFSMIYQKQMSNGHYYCLLCEHDNNVIGVLNLRFEEQLHHSGIELQYVYQNIKKLNIQNRRSGLLMCGYTGGRSIYGTRSFPFSYSQNPAVYGRIFEVVKHPCSYYGFTTIERLKIKSVKVTV